jgi:hypothetical protein
VLTISDGLISPVFEVQFPFQFPHAVGENGKRNWERDSRGRVVGRCAGHHEFKGG